MRAYLLLIIVAGLCGFSLSRPILGMYSYIWFALMRPDVLAWADDGRFPFSMMLAAVTCLGALQFSWRLPAVFSSPVVLTLLALQIPVLLSIPFALNPSLCLDPLNQYGRILFMSLLIPVFIFTQQHLRYLLLIIGLSLGFVGIKFGLFGVVNGGVHLTRGYGGLLADNNDLALAFVMTIPLCWYMRFSVPWKLARLLLLFMIFCMCAAVVMTHSRGGALALAVTIIALSLRSRHKIGALVLFALLAAPAVYMVQDSYLDRLSTLKNPEEEGSANSRIQLAKAAIAMWRDYPLLGVGFGGQNFAATVSQYLGWRKAAVAHNTYVQLLADCGIFALLIWCALLFGTIFFIGRMAKGIRQENPEMAHMGFAIQVSLIGFAVGSAFLSRFQFDMYYMLLMAAACWREVYHTRPAWALEEETAAQPAEAVAGVGA